MKENYKKALMKAQIGTTIKPPKKKKYQQGGDTERPPLPPASLVVYGCIDPNAANFNPRATQNDGSCTYIKGFGEQEVGRPPAPTDEFEGFGPRSYGGGGSYSPNMKKALNSYKKGGNVR
tara:strand:- start:109157 stop:109516 length:360 start_codon:yes stop_codon:yes gene_type:complete